MGPSKQLKQIIQTEHNIVKNLNWLEATSRLFTSVAEDLLEATEKQIHVVARTGPPNSESDRLNTRPRDELNLILPKVAHPLYFFF